jgi:hypothetical protein
MSSLDRLEAARAIFAELTTMFEHAATIPASAQAVPTVIDARRRHAQLSDFRQHISHVMVRLQELLR